MEEEVEEEATLRCWKDRTRIFWGKETGCRRKWMRRRTKGMRKTKETRNVRKKKMLMNTRRKIIILLFVVWALYLDLDTRKCRNT